jgi:hypothetical protein
MNIMVADILLTYGFKLETFTHIARADGKESKVFWFSSDSPKCEFDAETVSNYATSNHEALEAIDKEHPILWMRAALMNRNQLVEIIKQAPRMVEINNGARKCLISESASEETKRQVAAMI